MSNWTDYLADPMPIKAVFKEITPSGHGLIVHDITFSRQGPSVVIRLDLADFPASPPQKWAAAGFNTVQVIVAAVGVHQAGLRRISTEMIGDLMVKVEDSLLHLSLEGENVDLDVVASALSLSKISAYRS